MFEIYLDVFIYSFQFDIYIRPCFKDLTNELIIDLDNQIRSVKNQFKLLATDKADNFDLVTERKRMEAEIESISSRNTDVMERIIRQFVRFVFDYPNRLSVHS